MRTERSTLYIPTFLLSLSSNEIGLRVRNAGLISASESLERRAFSEHYSVCVEDLIVWLMEDVTWDDSILESPSRGS